MPINLEFLNPSKRYVWPESADEEEWVEFRLVPDDVNREFFKQIGVKPSRQVVFDDKTRQAQVVKDFELNDKQQEKFFELTWDYSIYDWYFVTPEGKKIECTKENKMLLMKNEPRFSLWANQCVEKMKDELLNFGKSAEGNS